MVEQQQTKEQAEAAAAVDMADDDIDAELAEMEEMA